MVPLRRWKKLSQTIRFKNTWWQYRQDSFELPDGGKGEYHYVHTEGASLVIPVHGDGRITLVRQYRYLGDRESLEFPCGGVKAGKTFEETAAQELAEEAGLAAGSLEWIGTFNPYNGVTDELCRIYLAEQLQEVESLPDDTEEFERVDLLPAEIEKKVHTGEIWDGMTLAAWAFARQHIR